MKKSLLFLSLLFSFSLQAQDFVNPLPIPEYIPSTVDTVFLDVAEAEHNFNPNGSDSLNTMVKTFAYKKYNNVTGETSDNSILGPTIAWQFGKTITMDVLNDLPERTTTHWHGAHVPQYADGGPHQIIEPEAIWAPTFEIKDKSATMWYHPHAMGLTYRQVQMGLAGMVYVEDASVDPLLSEIHGYTPHEYGVDDFPFIFQTKKFKRNGAGDIEIQAEDGYKKDYAYLVNGVVDPVFEAPASMTRLRVLNGDGKFSFNFRLVDADGNAEPFQLIATDAGYTTRSYQLNNILMAPGERTEWLLDLRGRQGDEFYIENVVSEIPAGVIGDAVTTEGYAVDRRLLKLVVGPDAGGPPSPILGFPIPLHPSEQPPMSEVDTTRVKTFRKDVFNIDGMNQNLFNIDSTLMNMMVVNDVVNLDDTEIWTIDNTTDIAHPWHIHDVHFWVTEIIDADGMALNKDLYPQIFDGPKDNVLVMPGWKLSYITEFKDYGTYIAPQNSYMYHCHILPHEDRGMMGQFVVWDGSDIPVSTEDPELSTRSMKLFPNPSNGVVYLEGESQKESRVEIHDLQGRLLRTMTIPAFKGAAVLDMSNLPSGMLIIEWTSEEGKAVSKVIME